MAKYSVTEDCNDRYTKARLGFDKEFAEEIIKTEELLAARIQVFLEEYNELAKNY